MNISFITLYPDQLSAFIRRGVLKRAIDSWATNDSLH